MTNPLPNYVPLSTSENVRMLDTMDLEIYLNVAYTAN